MTKRIFIILVMLLLLTAIASAKKLHVKANTGSTGPFYATAQWAIDGNPVACDEDSVVYEINNNTVVDFNCTSEDIPAYGFSGVIMFQPTEPTEECNAPISFSYGEAEEQITCDSCDSCTQAIQDASAGDTVKLTADIDDHSGTCIEWDNSEVTFDCEDHLIAGTGSGNGIELIGMEKNSIIQCKIKNFETGLYLEGSSDNLILNSWMESNSNAGVLLHGSSGNEFRETSMRMNKEGIRMDAGSNDNYLYFCGACHNEVVDINVVDGSATGFNNFCNTWANFRDDDAEGDGCFEPCGESLYCLSCEECNEAIQSQTAGNKVIINRDILLHDGTCIELHKDDIILKCRGNTITGTESGIGIDVDGNGNTIEDCIIGNFDTGIRISETSSGNYILENEIDSNKGDGIFLDKSSGNEILDNKIKDNRGKGIYLLESSGSIIQENEVDSNHDGILLYDSTENTIEQNKVYSSTYGIFMSGNVDGNTLNGNEVCYNTDDIYLSAVAAGTATGDNNKCNKITEWHDDSEAEGCKESCFKECSTCEECTEAVNSASAGETVRLMADITAVGDSCIKLENNDIILDCEDHKIIGNGGYYGIEIRGERNLVKNCFIRSFSYGISLISDSNRVVNNRLVANYYGLSISGYGGGGEVTDNSMMGNNYGLNAKYIDNVEITNNEFRSSKDAGILFEEDCNDNTISGNLFTENSVGFELRESTGNRIMDNRILSTEDGAGISLKAASSNNEIVLNMLESNKDGIIITENSTGNELDDNIVCNSENKDITVSTDSSASGNNNKCQNAENFNCAESCQEVKFSVLFVPLKWGGSQGEFDSGVEALDYFTDEVPLSSCVEKVKVTKMDIVAENFEDFDIHSESVLQDIRNFAIGKGYNLADYDVVAGLLEHENNGAGYGGLANFADTMLLDVDYPYALPHEMGHIFGLWEEYCSKPLGSTGAPHCSTGDNTIPNPLTAELPMDCPADGSPASNGIPCCANCDTNSGCCLGNKNSLGGRCYMGTVNAQGPRAFCDLGKAHFASTPRLQC